MTLVDAINYIKKSPIGFLATIDDKTPRVRAFGLFFVNNEPCFYTGADKKVCKQLLTNPAVEFAFSSADYAVNFRLSGLALPVIDRTIKLKLQKIDPDMGDIDNPKLAVFTITKLTLNTGSEIIGFSRT